MKREQIPRMSALPLPFALNGETSIHVKELDPFLDDGNLGSLGFDGKYQWNGNTAPSRFITRQLMNRLLGQISGRQFLKQCGALDTFDQNACDAIGGYPQGAVLQHLDGDVLYDVVSMRDNNDTDYTKVGVDGINWRIYGSSVFSYVYPDYGSTGQDKILKIWDASTSGGSSNGILSEDLTISSACWIQAFITNPTAAQGTTNYECGIALYNQYTERPSAIEDLKVDNTNYTVYELQEIGTIATAILPVLPGNKISAFASQILSEDRNIIIRKLTPVRTR